MRRFLVSPGVGGLSPGFYAAAATVALALSMNQYLRTRSRAEALFAIASAEEALVQRYGSGMNRRSQLERTVLARRMLQAKDPLGAVAELATRVALATDQLSVPPEVVPASEPLSGADSANRVAVRITFQSDTPQLINVIERLVGDSIAIRLDDIRIVAPSPVGDTETSLGMLDVGMTLSALRRAGSL